VSQAGAHALNDTAGGSGPGLYPAKSYKVLSGLNVLVELSPTGWPAAGGLEVGVDTGAAEPLFTSPNVVSEDADDGSVILRSAAALVELLYAQPTPADVIVAGTAGRTA